MAQLWGCCCCVVLVLLHTASPGSGPSPSCLLSFYTSSGLALLSQSFEDGAELLDSSLVQDFRECLSRCCGMPECQLALWMQTPVQGKSPCLLVNCLAANEPVCTFAPREGPQASTRFPGTYRNIQPPPAPQVDCLSPPKTGPCRASFSRWFYNASSKTCNEFTYGGCLSNGNNYRSELECWNYCNGVTEPGSNSVPVASRSTSSLKDCSGPCTASQFQCADGCCVSRHLLCDGTTRCADKSDEDYCRAVRDSYDQLIKKQDPGPQVNVRDSYDQLIKKQDPGPQVNERCTAPKKVGSCRAAFPRWYFDTTSRSCREFVYGGCKGNKNNFVSEHQCLVACAGQKEDVPQPHKLQSNTDDKEYCFVPAVTGRCRASFPRWFYNPASLTCERFVYGGCGGNKNNYPSELACLARCSGKTVPEDNQKGDEDGEVNTQHHVGTPRNIPAISMVIVLSICVLALLGGVIYFIVKLTKPDHTVSYQRAPHRDDKETLISTVQTL